MSYAAAFAVTKVIAIRLGPSGLGVTGAVLGVSAVVASVALAGQLNNLALWVSARPESRDRVSALSGIAAATIGIPLGLAVSLVLMSFLGAPVTWPVLLFGGAALLTGQVVALQRPALLAALDGPAAVTRFSLFFSLISMVVTILLVLLLPPDLLIVSLGLGALAGGVAGVLVTRVRRRRHDRLPQWTEVLSFIKSGSKGLPGVVVNAVAMGGLPAAVLVLVGEYEAGLFRAIWGVTTTIWALSMTLQRNVYFPLACRATKLSEYRALNAGVSRSVLVGAAIASALVAVGSPLILRLLYSEQFVVAATALSVFAVGALFRVWISANSYYVFATGRQGMYSLIEAQTVVMLVLGVLVGSTFNTVTALAVGASSGLLIAALTAQVVAQRVQGAQVPTAGVSMRDRALLLALFAAAFALIVLG